MSEDSSTAAGDGRRDTLTVTDNRTGRSYELPIELGAVRAAGLRQVKTSDDDFGLLSYDPAFMATASCRSAITFIDGDKGILRYRGYPIEQLAEQSSFLEVAYLLLNGELPTAEQLAEFTDEVTHHTLVHENVKQFIDGFHHDAHPMGILVGTVGALSTFYPEAGAFTDPRNRRLQMARLIAKMPTLAAFAFRHSRGLPYVYPDNELSYAGNFLTMMWRMSTPSYTPDPVLERALDVLFILHADHEQNCSTSAMRAVGSSRVDPYSAAAAATAALYGPLHGGANEQVLRMLREIGSVGAIPGYVDRVKQGEFRLMGFGHRVYKNYDPRAKAVRQLAERVFEVTGLNPLLEVAVELERIALSDDYFVAKKLYPNVDFYTGLIYEAMGFPVEMFPVLFAIGRMPGWLAQWEESLLDPEQKIARPRQLYVGHAERPYLSVDQRGHADPSLVEPPVKPIGGD
jgi:citrate synthase